MAKVWQAASYCGLACVTAMTLKNINSGRLLSSCAWTLLECSTAKLYGGTELVLTIGV